MLLLFVYLSLSPQTSLTVLPPFAIIQKPASSRLRARTTSLLTISGVIEASSSQIAWKDPAANSKETNIIPIQIKELVTNWDQTIKIPPWFPTQSAINETSMVVVWTTLSLIVQPYLEAI